MAAYSTNPDHPVHVKPTGPDNVGQLIDATPVRVAT